MVSYLGEKIMSVSRVCLMVAIILFIVAGIGVDSGRFSLLAVGLAFFAGSFYEKA